jgi:hypothetical protein
LVARNTNLNKHFWIIWPTNLSILSFLMKVNHETGRSHYIWHLSCCYYHWFDTSAGGLLVPEDIIHPLVLSRFWLSCLGSLVFRFQKHLNYWDFQFGLPCADQKRDALTFCLHKRDDIRKYLGIYERAINVKLLMTKTISF